MEVLKISTLFENMSSYIKKAQNGAVFLYPTDTIYGLGGIVNTSVIKTIDQIKQRPA